LNKFKSLYVHFASLITICLGCNNSATLRPVTFGEFESFVDATDYVTDAERYGWSIVQQNVFDFITAEEATWRKPDGINTIDNKKLPVTQVSYNDARAYCKWSDTRLPTYDEYWKLVENDNRPIVADNLEPISAVDAVNIVGNVWDITDTTEGINVRIAGGSLFCSEKTCNGTVEDRKLYVDKETGNLHIGFSVIE